MATIVNTLIEGLSQQMVQARLNTADAKPFLFGTYFPVSKVNGFIWYTIQNQLEKAHVAADLHANNASIVRKGRPMMESAKGDLPFLSISRALDRKRIKDYQTALAFAKDQNAIGLVKYWGNDIDFCFDGIQSELEYIAWKLTSGAGKLSFTSANNATYANDFDLDYDVDSEFKVKTATDWGIPASADVLGDLRTIIKNAKASSLNPKFAFLSLNTLYKIASTDQIIKACASYISNAVGMSQTPDLTMINSMLARQAWLNGIQLRVIDQTITREFSDGSSTSANPFDDDRIVLSESERLGTTEYDILQDSNPAIIRAERAHTVIKKYSTAEPLAEITIGEADAIPVFDSAYRNVYVRTDAVAWA